MDARLVLMKASGSFSSGPAGGQELDGLVTGLQRVCSVEHAHWKAAASFLKCVVSSQLTTTPLCNPEALRSQYPTPLGGRAVLILLVLANFVLCACILIFAEIRHLRRRGMARRSRHLHRRLGAHSASASSAGRAQVRLRAHQSTNRVRRCMRCAELLQASDWPHTVRTICGLAWLDLAGPAAPRACDHFDSNRRALLHLMR